MTKDENKDITSIQYNYLNLPTEITFGNGNSIEYIYSAAGVKVSKIVTDLSNTTAPNIFTDYLDGFQYVGGMLNFFPHAEGYVRATSQTEDPADPQLVFNYVYNYTDHLGNIRLSYTKDPVSNELDILEENNYYPFGLKHKIYGGIKKDYLKEEPGNGGGGAIRPGVVIESPYNYKYNGKEWQDELGLGLYDYGWRQYDPAIARWVVSDPLAEQYRRWSPYNYAVNNPLRYIDPDGMGVDDVIITGDLKDKAFNQLQTSVKGELNLSMDSAGKVTATAVEGATLSDASQGLLTATEDTSRTVELNATSSNFNPDGSLMIGGSFGGSTVNADGTVTATQNVNPNQMDVIDGLTGRGEGVGTL